MNPFVIVVTVGNDKNVFGPYPTFEKAQSVVGSYIFGHLVISKPDETVDNVTITEMTMIDT